MDRTLRSPPLDSQVYRFKPTGLFCVGMDDRTGLQCEGGTRDALLGRILDAAEHIRNSELKLLGTTSVVHNEAAACVVGAVAFLKINFKHR